MRMNIPFAPIALAVAMSLGAASTASAGVLNDDFDVTLNVAPSCAMIQATNDVIMNHDPGFDPNAGGMGNSVMSLTCNKDLPYEIEVDTAAGGAITLTDSTTTKTVAATLTISDDAEGYNPVAWGSAANGEAFARVGTGLQQVFTIDVAYGDGTQPAVGVYTAHHNVAINF